MSHFETIESALRSLSRYLCRGGESFCAPDIGQVRGQESAKVAALVAASGNHHLLLVGPPGEGKSLLAKTIPSFLPPLSSAEATELSSVYNVSRWRRSRLYRRPVRVIGPTITPASLLGGGRSRPVPGELALAHHGVLVLDEIVQFSRTLLDLLRQPLQDGQYTITRNGQSVTYGSDCLVVATSNPCPCGYYPRCTCNPGVVSRYRSSLSGPILDRLDLSCWLDPLSPQDRFAPAIADQSIRFAAHVLGARDRQWARQGCLNSALDAGRLFDRSANLLRLDSLAWQALDAWAGSASSRLSTRRVGKLLQVSRTLADLYQSPIVTLDHLREALWFVRDDPFDRP